MNNNCTEYVFSAAMLALPMASFAQGGNPEFVISRDVPQHDSFRPGDKGQATTIATARPDLVLSTTKELQGRVQTISDAMLGTVDGANGKPDGLASSIAPNMNGTGLGKPNIFGPVVGTGAATSIDSAMQPAAGIGSMVGRSMAPMGGLLQAMPGMK